MAEVEASGRGTGESGSRRASRHRHRQPARRSRPRGADCAPAEPPDLDARRTRERARSDRRRLGRPRRGDAVRRRAAGRRSPSSPVGRRGRLHDDRRALRADRCRDKRVAGRRPSGGAWAARGLRVPARNALLADVVPPASYGRAYGFERAMDNLGAIGGPLVALALVAAFGVRTAILLSVIPRAAGRRRDRLRDPPHPKPTERTAADSPSRCGPSCKDGSAVSCRACRSSRRRTWPRPS